MPILWTKTAQMIHLLVLSILGVIATLFPLPASSLEISTPVGIQQIGQNLNLKSTLSNMPEGTESQLRSTCLKARISPLESLSDTYDSAASREVLVNFDPTIRRGGLLEFKSLMPVNDAVVEMELVSDCPLIVFNTKWTLIMKQGGGEQTTVNVTPVNSTSTFDPSRSSLLASSRRLPPPRVDRKPVWMDAKEAKDPQPAQDEQQTAVAASTPAEETAVTAEEAVDKPFKVVSLESQLLDVGLNESQPEQAALTDSLGVDQQNEPISASIVKQEMMMYLGLGASALLLMTLLVYRQFFRKKARDNSISVDLGPNGRQAPVSVPKDLASISREHVLAYTAEPEPMSVGSHRVWESLMGSDDPGYDTDMNMAAQDFDSDVAEPSSRSSLKISLELINRADIPSWKLPASYASLVESRNKSLELHRTMDALLLRSHIGLVELAFQDAKQGLLTSTESSLELLEKVLGEQWYELELKHMLSVPDVVKSHVRAKMCEIAGAEKRQLLRENLVNLHSQIISPALCFRSNGWREFLSEEGILE